MSPECEGRLKAMLERHEGFRARVYNDTEGIPTIGIGRNVGTKGITRSEAEFLLENDINEALAALMGYWWFATLDEVRQAALTDMMFNLGATRFAGFHDFIHAMEQEDYVAASREMLDSKWAKQVGARSVELSDMVKTGEWQ